MKPLLRDYIASLRERNELDAILPDLLSEAGYQVFSRPAIGTAQRGVDVAAVGKDGKGRACVYLFCVKPGDLTRTDWDGGGPQKMRPSLNEIIDEYIPTRIPPAYKTLPVVIVICLGGEVHQSVRSLVTNFTKRETTRKVRFEEWTGDTLAEMMLGGLLREKVLPKPLRSHFQKSVAMADQPDVAYLHFARLVSALRGTIKTDKDRIRVARQIYICTWILFVWARDADNLDAPYRVSELALLNAWELAKRFRGKNSAKGRALSAVVFALAELHLRIASLYYDTKVKPFVDKLNALSVAVNSAESVDINLRLFDVLGRLAVTGSWLYWTAVASTRKPPTREMLEVLANVAKAGIQMIASNPVLLLPVADNQATDIALFLQFAGRFGHVGSDIRWWLSEMANRLYFTVMSHGRYPISSGDYRDLIEHPKERTDEYLKEMTKASTLLPLIAAWLTALGDKKALRALTKLTNGPLKHCTLQSWVPDTTSEEHLYLGDDNHGAAVTELPITEDGRELLKQLADASAKTTGFASLSAEQIGFWPLILTACRHYRLPVPPQFWIGLLVPETEVPPADAGGAQTAPA